MPALARSRSYLAALSDCMARTKSVLVDATNVRTCSTTWVMDLVSGAGGSSGNCSRSSAAPLQRLNLGGLLAGAGRLQSGPLLVLVVLPVGVVDGAIPRFLLLLPGLGGHSFGLHALLVVRGCLVLRGLRLPGHSEPPLFPLVARLGVLELLALLVILDCLVLWGLGLHGREGSLLLLLLLLLLGGLELHTLLGVLGCLVLHGLGLLERGEPLLLTLLPLLLLFLLLLLLVLLEAPERHALLVVLVCPAGGLGVLRRAARKSGGFSMR
mmetsp:Transcript_91081/g.294659  ORF Transcript_91081/g.294659 Transcript_91081/m.294659 type:complete len:268 (+) Transcript_91081:208-1011(+)